MLQFKATGAANAWALQQIPLPGALCGCRFRYSALTRAAKTGQAVLQGLHPSRSRIGRTRRATLQPIRRSGVASGRRNLPEISRAVRRENLTESESRSESEEDMGREFVGKTVRSISLLVLALASMVASGQAPEEPNHLRGQTSPYLKRAVSQPVDWYPWSAEAFKRAIELDRPILLYVAIGRA